jgi:P pilus assembly chaperone PapD
VIWVSGWSARRRGFPFAALFVGTLLAAPGRVAAQVSVDQAEVFLDPSVRGPRVASFNVTNEGAAPVQVSIYLGDWERREDGEHNFPPPGTLPHSCAKYLQVFPLSLRLPPGARQAVRLAQSGADSLKSACWSIAFVETNAPSTAAGRQVTYVTRLGVKIYLLPPGLTKEGDVEEMAVQRGDSGGRRIAITFHATGGMPLWVHGTLEYRRADNSVAATDSIAEFPVLPNARRRIAVRARQLAPGKYLALALLDYGGSEIAAGQIPLDVP